MQDQPPVAEAEFVELDGFDMDNPPMVGHNFIDRGLKYTCENAGHPYHEAWKVGVVKPM